MARNSRSQNFLPILIIGAVLAFTIVPQIIDLFTPEPVVFDIVSGSENESLEQLAIEFGRSQGIEVRMHYKGSVDIMLELADAEFPYDAVWPANSLWISLGDQGARKVQHSQSIMTSPVVFGIRRPVAQRLGWIDAQVSVSDILAAIEADQLRFMMTSATQSNSGASAYLGFLYALAGNPDVITSEDLRSEEVRRGIRTILGGINRSSGSSGWLKDLFLESNRQNIEYDAMVNYEALLIETNQELVRSGQEPLYIVYPVDGIVLADSPLGFVDQGIDEQDSSRREQFFLDLQAYLLGDEAQSFIAGAGRRTGGPLGNQQYDPQVFNSDWGIDTDSRLPIRRYPSAAVIREALQLYQTDYRKPSLTVFALDYSGSMGGTGERQMKEAMATLLDQRTAAQYLLQASEEDITIVMPFASTVKALWEVEGNDPDQLLELSDAIDRTNPNGGTDIYTAVAEGLRALGEYTDLDEYSPAIILMTDGVSTEGADFAALRRYYTRLQLDIPVFSIMFGEADESQLDEIAELTRARVFDGRTDLVAAFRKVKGYN